MRINSLKFQEITNAITNRQLNLNLFDKSDVLFQQEGNRSAVKTCRNIDKFKYTKIRQKSRSKLIEESDFSSSYQQSHKKQEKNCEDILFHLQESLLSYINFISSEQKKSIKCEMQLLSRILSLQSSKSVFEQMDRLQLTLSRKVKNRLIHLIFYLLYNQLLKHSNDRDYNRQIKNYTLGEYYSRKFNFKKLTLFICISIQQMYTQANNYELGREYARKALKLAVVLGNHYIETKMIETLYILNYYEGRLNESIEKVLPKQQRQRILQTYSEEHQCPRIFQQEGVVQDVRQFNLERHNNFIENSIPNENIKYFQSNYHQIIKSIPGKHINVRNIMNKVSSVGVVRKYFGKDNYITLKPQCHIVKPLYQQQVLITHKKQGGHCEKSQPWRKLIQRIRKIMDYTISSYTYQL